MLYLAAASFSSGLARAQSGHSRSSNSKMATRAPAGGRSADLSPTGVVLDWPENCAKARDPAGAIQAIAKMESTKMPRMRGETTMAVRLVLCPNCIELQGPPGAAL